MSQFTVLSDAELDAVSGGFLNGGAGGAGGTNEVGAYVGGNVSGSGNNLSTTDSGNNTANGGAGGAGGRIVIVRSFNR